MLLTRQSLNRFIFAFISLFACSAGLSAHAASAVEFSEQEVEINAGDVVLAATLFRPASQGKNSKLPAIVTAHGSAPTTREGVGFYTARALEMGFAVLSFDKRGTGRSSGTYKPFNVSDSAGVFDDLALDVVWSVRWLSEQPGIDASRIGLFGGSQAGWIMPLAASKEPLVRFIIIGEGVPLTAGEENAHETYLMQSAPDAETYFDLPISAADQAVYRFQGEPGFDPAAVLESLDIPVLWLFGLRDSVIPVAPSLRRLEGLIRDGKTNYDVHIYPFGDHNFVNVASGKRYQINETLRPWLEKQGILD